MKSFLFVLVLVVPLCVARGQSDSERNRAREIGLVVGILSPGPMNAITDVDGVRVGHRTIVHGDAVRTGVTAILPHAEDLFRNRVPAAVYVGNGFGKLVGFTQVDELGELESPILLTCTLCVWRAADHLLDILLAQPGMGEVRSLNVVVGETNDGFLSDIRRRPIGPQDVRAALEGASEGPVEEGSVGAGTGTVAFGWKGGIGTSSRVVPVVGSGYTIGVLVQSNFGGVLTMNGAPVGRELGRFAFKEDAGVSADGSIMIVVATDAPLNARLLRRLAKRSLVGLARTGASMTNGSGDYVIAFSTAKSDAGVLSNDRMSLLFQAVAEATEEAIYNSLLMATTVTGHRGTVEALPLGETVEILRRYSVLDWDRTISSDR